MKAKFLPHSLQFQGKLLRNSTVSREPPSSPAFPAQVAALPQAQLKMIQCKANMQNLSAHMRNLQQDACEEA